MKKRIIFALLLAFTLSLFGCAEDPDAPAAAGTGEVFDIAVSFAGWHEGEFLGGLNADKMSENKTRHLPIYRFDRVEDIAAFRENSRAFVFDHSHNEFPSFNDTVSRYDDAFFAENVLFAVYVPAESGTYRYGVRSVACEGGGFTVFVEQTNRPEAVTLDLTGWFITLAVPRAMIEGCTEFDAVYAGIKE